MSTWWPCARCVEWSRCYRQVWHGDERDHQHGSDCDFKFGKKACDRLINWITAQEEADHE